MLVVFVLLYSFFYVCICYVVETGTFCRGMLLHWRFGFSDWFSLNQNNLNEGFAPNQELGTRFLQKQCRFPQAAGLCYKQRET